MFTHTSHQRLPEPEMMFTHFLLLSDQQPITQKYFIYNSMREKNLNIAVNESNTFYFTHQLLLLTMFVSRLVGRTKMMGRKMKRGQESRKRVSNTQVEILETQLVYARSNFTSCQTKIRWSPCSEKKSSVFVM